MATGQSEGSVYQLKSGKNAGKWVGAVVTGWRDGKPIRATRMRDTEDEAKKALRDVLNDRDNDKLPTPTTWTYGPWLLTEWLAHAKKDPRISHSTWIKYEQAARIHVAPVAGNRLVYRLKPEHMQGVLDHMEENGLSASSRLAAWVVMGKSLDCAIDRGLRKDNPVRSRSVTRPIPKRRPINVPAKTAIATLYAAIEGVRLEARWRLLFDVGPRQGETLGLEWAAVDLSNPQSAVIRIAQQLVKWPGSHGCGQGSPDPDRPRKLLYPCGQRRTNLCPKGTPSYLAIKEPKTDSGSRTVPLTPDTCHVFSALKRLQAKERLIAGDAYKRWMLIPVKRGPELDHYRVAAYDETMLKASPRGARIRLFDPVFANDDGRLINPFADWKAWCALLDSVDLDHTNPHAGRHAAVREMLDAGVSLPDVSDLIGHGNYAFTKNVYGHWSPEVADTARDKLAAHHARRTGKGAPGRRRRV
ncbi:tyrosine-type recombinase/integrase [Kineosporia babensis]|uniref:Site-specific integrase n=1 Tax=Kineosporia babensis TaxID=499548 RepID=A0A9X1SYF3_9ACTN|nr:tyrosine-type recombinase/integrase [Kineosporia babensis]MCD5310948.1 site-specific integrase [Kineosporia babensis]